MHIENGMKVDVSSQADLILFPESYPDTLLDDSVHGESISVISVFEVNLKTSSPVKSNVSFAFPWHP